MNITRILLSEEKRQAYYQSIHEFEKYSLQWLGIIGCLYTLAFIAIDFGRAGNFKAVIIFRSISLLISAMAWRISRSKKLTVKNFQWFGYFFSTAHFTLGFLMDFNGEMPIFFLTNYIILFLFACNATLGYPLKFKIYQAVLLVGFYIFYAFRLSPHSQIHIGQIWNVLLNSSLSLLFAILIKRHNFLSFESQNRLVKSREKIFELNALKSKLISILSHDLKSPLNTLAGLLHLKESNAISENELRDYYKNVSLSVENLSVMMNDLLRWSKFQLEGFQPQRNRINLAKATKEVINIVELEAAQKKIKIIDAVVATHEADLDEEIIKMAFRNFLSNAIKFSREGSTITVASKQTATDVILSVADSGIGMPPQQLTNLFTSAKTSTHGTQNEKGSGIGLIITKDFIELLGGTIHVESAEGKGSTFSIRFPI